MRHRDQYMVKISREGSTIMVEEAQAYFLLVEDMISRTKALSNSWAYEIVDDRPLILRLLDIKNSSEIPNYPTFGSHKILSTVGKQLNKYKNDGLLTEQDMVATLAKA